MATTDDPSSPETSSYMESYIISYDKLVLICNTDGVSSKRRNLGMLYSILVLNRSIPSVLNSVSVFVLNCNIAVGATVNVVSSCSL